ncbi:MAG: hypothetical protein HC795_11820 [Coleofasciculaceae cyanobacterium RL_1_1]|nr:hypothetical protein [Coleofasciculaceae cyanobacterium RL_1_1]
MEKIKLQQTVGQDGILHLHIPTGIADRELEITIIDQPIPQTNSISLAQPYGICANDPIAIDHLGISDSLDDDLNRNQP